MADTANNDDPSDIKPTLGYHLTLEEASKEIAQYEERTGTRFGFLRADPDFGSIAWTKDDCRIQWEEMEQYQGERLEFDGIPFMVLGTKHLGCQYGVRIPARHNRYLEWRKEEGADALGRKSSCPARIVLKEIIKFPDYKIDNNTNYEKKKWSKILREDIYAGLAQPQRRLYVHLPSTDDHLHTLLDKALGPHCLICNGKLSASARSAISLFANEIRTSHRQLEVVGLLSEILGQVVDAASAHSHIMCTRCFNLIDDIDSLEEQLVNKKQMVANRYKRTLAEVTQAPPSPVDFILDEESDSEDIPFGKRRGRGRGRGKKPLGRPRSGGRGRGWRGRGRGRGQGSVSICGDEASDTSLVVKIEQEDTITEPASGTSELCTNTTLFKAASASPPALRTIKKEDIMNDMETPHAGQHKIESIEALAIESEDERDGEVEGEVLAVVGEGEVEATVLEVVEEVLEEEEKQGRLFGCSQCDKQFLTKAAIRNHVKSHDRFDAAYDCEECEKSFSNKYSLKAHLKTHLNRDRPHRCRVCNKSFYTRYHLNAHLKSHEGVRNFVCELCGKALSTQKTLELHSLTHTGEKPFQCEICGSTFRQRSNLLTHIKATHYQEKNYHCEICQKSFVRKRLLVYHINSVHTGQRPYKCDLCNASFVYPHYYKRHLRKHTGDRPHKCHVCGKTFASRENRNAHMFIHSDKKPYECKLCGAGFMRKPMCASHLILHGQLENPEAYIIFNSPSLLVSESESNLVNSGRDEVARAVTTVTVADENGHGTIEDQTQIMRDGKIVKVMSRPVHIIETDDTTRYVIHSGDRVREENMDQFFAALQSQVVEVRTEDF